MGILEFIIVMVLISNDFSFGEIMVIMLIFFPVFYGLILPLLFGTIGKLQKRSNNLQGETTLLDKDQSNNHEEATTIDNSSHIVAIAILNSLTQKLQEKKFHEVIKQVGQINLDFLEELDDEKRKAFYIIAGVAYQEIGELDNAEVFFDRFLTETYITEKLFKEYEQEGLNEIAIKMLLLIREVEDLGFHLKGIKKTIN